MNSLVIANIISFITACFTVASSWTKNPRRTYWYQVAQCLTYAVASYFFGVYASILLMLINAFRNGMVAAGKYSAKWMMACSVVSLIVGLAVNGGSIPGYISILMTVYYTISSFYLRSDKAVKLNLAIDLTMWFVYDLMICDIADSVVDSTGVVLALITIWRIRRSEKKEAADKPRNTTYYFDRRKDYIMQAKLKSVFSAEKFLKCCGIPAVILSAVQVAMCIASGNYFLSFEMCVAAVTIVAVIIASQKVPQSANLPVAATLMLYLLRFAERFFTYLSYPEVSAVRLAAIFVLPLLMAVMMALHLAMHLTSNRDRMIKAQQVLYVLVVVYGVFVRCNSAAKAGAAFAAASYVISGLALAFTFLTLCSAEVRQ